MGWPSCFQIGHLFLDFRYPVSAHLFTSGNKGFDSTFEDAAFEEDTTLALEAFNTNISAEPDYLPLVAAAGVFFLEADYIAQLYLDNHWLLFKSRYVLVNFVPQD